MKPVTDNMNTPDPVPNQKMYFKVKPEEQIYELDFAKKEFDVIVGILDIHTHKRMIIAKEGCWYCVAKSPDAANKKFNQMAIDSLKEQKK